MDAAAAGFWGAIAGALIGGGLTATANHLTATRMFREQRFEKAADKFRYTIRQEFRKYKDVAPDDVTDELLKELESSLSFIQDEAREFSYFLPKGQRDVFLNGLVELCIDISATEAMKKKDFDGFKESAFTLMDITVEYERSVIKKAFEQVTRWCLASIKALKSKK